MDKPFETMSALDVWEVIHDTFLLSPENELAVMRRWVPIYNEKLKAGSDD